MSNSRRPRTTAPDRVVAWLRSRRSSGSSENAQVCRASPPVPRPLSGPGSGPVTKPSREIEMSAMIRVIQWQTGFAPRTHRCDPYRRLYKVDQHHHTEYSERHTKPKE